MTLFNTVSDAERTQLRNAIDGAGDPPDWAEVLLMAEAWGMPPWRIIEEAPAEWVDRFLLFHALRHQSPKDRETGDLHRLAQELRAERKGS